MERILASCNADRVFMQIDIASANLNLSVDFYEKIIDMYYNLRVDGFISDNTYSAVNMAGVLIYWSVVRYGENLTQKEVSDALGIRESSLRIEYKKYKEFLSEVRG